MKQSTRPAHGDSNARRRLGEKLRQAREYLGLSQDEVARHLRVPRTALTNIESGQRRIDALELKSLPTSTAKPSVISPETKTRVLLRCPPT